MILTCPNCGSQFKVDASKIPNTGREVRCASCKHQWHAYPDNVAAELTPPEPEPEAVVETEPGPDLIAFPDPEPESIETEDSGASSAGALPEDAFAGDSDVGLEAEAKAPEDSAEEEAYHEPELISVMDDEDPYAFAPEDITLPSDDDAERSASLMPLMAMAVGLLLAVLVTAVFALPGPFGFVHAAIGSPSSSGLQLEEVSLTERPSRSKARFNIEGKIRNVTDVPMPVPTLRVAMLTTDGEVLLSREYEDAAAPIIAPGEHYPFRALNLETSFKDQLAHFVVDIGSGAELSLRRPDAAVPSATMLKE